MQNTTVSLPYTQQFFYTPQEIADYLGVSVKAVHARIRLGKLKAVQLTPGGCLRIPADQLVSCPTWQEAVAAHLQH